MAHSTVIVSSAARSRRAAERAHRIRVWIAGMTALLLLFWIAAWAIVTGVLEIISAIRLRTVIEHEWSWIIGGVLSVLFGAIMIAQPGAGALAVVWLIGAYAILFGFSLFALAWRVYSFEQAEHEHRGGASAHQPVAP